MFAKYFPRLKLLEWLLLLSIVILYLLVTTHNLTGFPIFVDEAIYGRWSQIALHDAAWRFISLTDGKQPLFMWATMPMFKLFSDPLYAIRVTSVLSGLSTVLGLFYAGYLLKGKKMGYLAALLGIVTPFLFFYNRLAVVDSMLTAFGIWIFSLSMILAKEKRLDLALILGLFTGLSLLVKSPAQIFLLLIPLAYLLNPKKESWTYAKLARFTVLFGVIYVLAQAIYSIQRLSPFMYIIEQKNADFTLPLTQALSDFHRLSQNFVNTVRWLDFYMTWPIMLVFVVGAVTMLRDSWRKTLYTFAWFLAPLSAEILIASLYRSRYIVFVAPYVILFVAHFIASQKAKLAGLLLALLLVMPVTYIAHSLKDPLTTPLLSDDADYLDGWSSGAGVKEIANYLIGQAQTSDFQIYVGTEGTFGLLPHGLELYTYGTPNLAIEGFWPLDHLPPQSLLERRKSGQEVYFVLNNTQIQETVVGLQEVMSYKKRNDSYIRLYKLD